MTIPSIHNANFAETLRGLSEGLKVRGLQILPGYTDHDIHKEERLIAAGAPPISMREGADAMGRPLDSLPETRAVICVSDLSAFGALTECQRRGIRLPKDIRTTGFCDCEIVAVSAPALTPITPLPRAIGARTAALLLDVPDTPATLRIAPDLILRQSSRRTLRDPGSAHVLGRDVDQRADLARQDASFPPDHGKLAPLARPVGQHRDHRPRLQPPAGGAGLVAHGPMGAWPSPFPARWAISKAWACRALPHI